MRRRSLAVALVCALPAVAQEPSAPASGLSVPAQPVPAPPPAAAGAQPSAAPRFLDGWELDVAIWGGPYSGGASEAAAGGFDVTLLGRSGLLAVGARAGSEKLAAAFASDVAAVAGALIPLSARTRLDLLADAGVGLHMIPPDGVGCEAGSVCDEREGARKLRPVLGARAGFTFLSGDGRLAFTLGAFGRFVPEQDVALERKTCAFSSCTTAAETRTIGGKVFGAFLGLGFPRKLD